MTTVEIPLRRKADAEALLRALTDDQLYAFAVIVGTLLPLSGRHRANILNFARTLLAPEE